MKLSFLAFVLVTFCLQVYGTNDTKNHKLCHQRRATPVNSQVYHGKRYEHHHARKDETDRDTPPGPSISNADPQGPFQPSSPAINVTRIDRGRNDNTTLVTRSQCTGNRVKFDFKNMFGNTGINPNSPSGSRAGKVVFATANKFAAVSLNEGDNFFPPINPVDFAGPDFCCNQVVHYIHSIKRFVWLLELYPDAHGSNKLRLITFHPWDVDKTGPTKWLYTDIESKDLKCKGQLVFGDLAVGDHKLWVSATVTGVGLTVIRIPIPALDVPNSFTYWYTDPADGAVAYRARLAQNPGDTAFWAGHSILGTTLRVFKWPEFENHYYWCDIVIKPWPANFNNFVAPCPGSGVSWVDNTIGRVLGATRRKKEVWFSWAASKGGGFKNVHIQVAQIDPSAWPNLILNKQWQIWHPHVAYAYPALYTNKCDDVGLAVAFGSDNIPYNPSSAVGIADGMGLLTGSVYYEELSDVCQRRFGDYLTVRKGKDTCFGGYTYAGKPASPVTWRSRYLEFGRG